MQLTNNLHNDTFCRRLVFTGTSNWAVVPFIVTAQQFLTWLVTSSPIEKYDVEAVVVAPKCCESAGFTPSQLMFTLQFLHECSQLLLVLVPLPKKMSRCTFPSINVGNCRKKREGPAYAARVCTSVLLFTVEPFVESSPFLHVEFQNRVVHLQDWFQHLLSSRNFQPELEPV